MIDETIQTQSVKNNKIPTRKNLQHQQLAALHCPIFEKIFNWSENKSANNIDLNEKYI